MRVSVCTVFITTPIGKSAAKLAKGLLQNRLAACVNVISSLSSHYWWEGKINHGRESLLIVKTRKTLLPNLMKFVREHHPYTVPEIIALPIVLGNTPYLKWMLEETSPRS